jgi:hypothetical protein
MGIADAYQPETDASISAMAAMPPEPPKVPAKWNGWSSLLRGPAAAVNEFAASASEVAVGTWRALREMDNQDAKAQHDQGGVKWNDENDFSTALRSGADYWRPDPVTASRAEQMVFDVSRFATKAVGYTLATGNPLAGAAVLTTDEGMTASEALKAQGVDPQTRQKIGILSGAAAGAGVILPVSGSTWAQTIGLVGVGGPGAFVAQQQATKTILENANYVDLAQQYDPLDPWGLALSTLVPAGFGAWGMRGTAARRGAAAEPRPVADGTNAVRKPVEPARPMEHAQTPESMPRAAAADETRIAPTQEHIDAALTHNLTLMSSERDVAARVHAFDEAARVESAKTGNEALFPPVYAFRDVMVGDAQIVPRPIGEGRPLFGASTPAGLDDLMFVDHEVAAKPMVVVESRDLPNASPGAADEVKITFRPDSLSGERGALSGDGAPAGASYHTDLVAPRAIQSIEMSASAEHSLRAVTRARLESGFERTDAEDGKVLFTRRGLDTDGRPVQSAPARAGETPKAPIVSAETGRAQDSTGKAASAGPEKKQASGDQAATDQSLAYRVQEIEQSAPDTVVGLDENGSSITARQFLEDVRREAREGTETELGSDDAPLLNAAANCFLATGAM